MQNPTPVTETSAAWRTVTDMGHGFVAMLPRLAVGLVEFLLFWAVAAATRRSVQSVARRRLEFPGAATAFGRLAYAAILLLGALVAVTVAFPSMTPASLFSALGIGGVAIGFAFKDIFQNLLAGILLLVRQPFRAGDEIRAGAFTGVVESIEARATFIRTYDGQRIIVPNSVIYTEALAAAGIDLPLPTRVVLFHDQTEDADGVRGRQREGWPVEPTGVRQPNHTVVR